MIFLFFSGSVTPSNFCKNLSLQLTRIRFISNCFLKTSSTSSPSFFLSKPWSTNIQVKFLPIALCNKTAATDESTPPDNAHNAFLSPIFSFKLLIFSFANEEISQSPVHLHISAMRITATSCLF